MKQLTRLILPIILLILGIQFMSDYFGDTTKEERVKLEGLVSSGEETLGILNSEYKEKTIKIAKLPIKTYEVSYRFMVEGKEYSGTKTLRDKPTEPTIQVRYLPSNPTINAATPEEELAFLKESKDSAARLLIGLVLTIIGLGLGFLRYKAFQKSRTA